MMGCVRHFSQQEWDAYDKGTQLSLFQRWNIVVVRPAKSYPVNNWDDPALGDLVDLDAHYQIQGDVLYDT